jgi:hypothetical protein
VVSEVVPAALGEPLLGNDPEPEPDTVAEVLVVGEDVGRVVGGTVVGEAVADVLGPGALVTADGLRLGLGVSAVFAAGGVDVVVISTPTTDGETAGAGRTNAHSTSTAMKAAVSARVERLI